MELSALDSPRFNYTQSISPIYFRCAFNDYLIPSVLGLSILIMLCWFMFFSL